MKNEKEKKSYNEVITAKPRRRMQETLPSCKKEARELSGQVTKFHPSIQTNFPSSAFLAAAFLHFLCLSLLIFFPSDGQHFKKFKIIKIIISLSLAPPLPTRFFIF